MFAKRYFVFVLFFALILMITGCCLLPSPTPKTHTITATAGVGGSISPAGELSLTGGGSQTYTFAPDEGYEVSDVLIDGISIGPASSYTFTDIQEDHTIQVNFIQQTQPSTSLIATITKSITSTAGTGGSIDPEGSVKVKMGKDQTFTITALSPCYEIEDVLVDGASVGPVDTYTFQDVQQGHTIEASFVLLGPRATNIDTDVDYGSIQDAIDNSQAGQSIVVCPGTYYENIVFEDKNITLRSADPSDPAIVAATIIDGGGQDSVVIFTGGDTSTLEGLTIQNGNVNHGGGIYVNPGITYGTSPTITGNIITGNTSDGIYVGYSGATITGNTISTNTGKGIYVDSGGATIAGNTITGNDGGVYLGSSFSIAITGNNISNNANSGIYLGTSSATITGNTITGNTAQNGGGVKVSNMSSATITDNEISDNIAISFAGGIFVDYSNNTNISGNTIIDNAAQNGGGIVVDYSGSITITDNEISSNTANSNGGGLYVSSNTPINPTIITGNIITGNTAEGILGNGGGGIFVMNSSPTIDNNILTENTSNLFGGGLCLEASSPIIENNTITYNHCLTTNGGGIFVSGDSDLLPAIGWGTGRDNIPTGNPLVPAEGVEYTIADNQLLGNEHGNPLDYTDGAHVYFY